LDIHDTATHTRAQFARAVPHAVTVTAPNVQAQTDGYGTTPTTYGFGVAPRASTVMVVGEPATGGAPLLLSVDAGRKWTALPPPVDLATAYAVAHNGSLWVLAGADSNGDGRLYCSDNGGTQWIAVHTQPLRAIRHAVFNGADNFVAIDVSGNTLHSPNGVHWRAGAALVSPASAPVWNGVEWMVGCDTAGGASSGLFRSADGIAWSAVAGFDASFTAVRAVCWTGQQWVLSGTTSSGYGTVVYEGEEFAVSTKVSVTGMDQTVTSIAFNGSVFVAGGSLANGSGATASLAYSYDGRNWVSLGTTVFGGAVSQVQWLGSKFVAVGTESGGNGPCRIASSANGVQWTVLSSASNGSSALAVARAVGTNTAHGEHLLVFDCDVLLAGNAQSRDGGATWEPLRGAAPPAAARLVGRSVTQTLFVDCGAADNGNSYVRSELFGTRGGPATSIQLADLSCNQAPQWNGRYWLSVGRVASGAAATAGNVTVVRSYDGYTWTPVAFGATSDTLAVGAAWNGTHGRWVVSGHSGSSGNSDPSAWTPFLLVGDASAAQWTDVSSAVGVGGGPIQWNAVDQCFVCGGLAAANASPATVVHIGSADGTQWTAASAGNYGRPNALAYSEELGVWVLSTLGSSGASGELLCSTDGARTWTHVAGSTRNQPYADVAASSAASFAAVDTLGAVVCSATGVDQWAPAATNVDSRVRNLAWSRPRDAAVLPRPYVVVGGSGQSHSLAWAPDAGAAAAFGLRGLTATCFSQTVRTVHWNGLLWIAGGEGALNTLAYSYNGREFTGLGKSVFSICCHQVHWNGAVWVAVGEGADHTLAYSVNGIAWTGLGKTVFSSAGRSVAWNGRQWMAVGFGSTHTAAVSSDGVNWTGLGTSAFTYPHCVRWAHQQWMVVTTADDAHAGAVAVSSNASTWTYAALPLTVCYSLAWNGREVVAVGAGTTSGIAVSATGTSGWSLNTDLSYNGVLRTVEWTGREFVLAGENSQYYVGLPDVAAAGSIRLFARPAGASALPLQTVLCVGVPAAVGAFVPDQRLLFQRGDKIVVYGPAAYPAGVSSSTVSLPLDFLA
jgi:hypothetical protein